MRIGNLPVLDYTAGHPDSVSAAFEVVRKLPARQIHAAIAMRGKRGRRINRMLAKRSPSARRMCPSRRSS